MNVLNLVLETAPEVKNNMKISVYKIMSIFCALQDFWLAAIFVTSICLYMCIGHLFMTSEW